MFDVLKAMSRARLGVWVSRPLAGLLAGIGINAHAAGGGGGMPWEGPLTTVANSLTGPTAIGISIIAMAAAGATLVFGGEMNEFMRKLVLLVLAISLLVFGSAVMTTLFGVGGAVIV